MTHSAEGRGVDISQSGVGIECLGEVKPGSVVRVESRDASVVGDCVVVHCTRRGGRYHVGMEFREEEEEAQRQAAQPQAAPPQAAQPKAAFAPSNGNQTDGELDLYDILQISNKADMQTIHRVFRIMAARFHPDNPETGDVEEFIRMKKAYAVLSDPERRADYDAQRETREVGTMPIFELKDFVTGVEAEANRRLGVLSLLYNQRRTSPDHPGVSLLEMETRMGFPREYLQFTTWYLRCKDFMTVADNSDFALTAAGVDFVEKEAGRNEILGKLLKPGSPMRRPGSKPRQGPPKAAPERFLLGTASGAKVD